MQILKSLLGMLLVAAIIAAGFYFIGPDLLKDWQMKNNYVTAENGRLTGGKCRTKLVITFCHLSIQNTIEGKLATSNPVYLFFSLPGESYTAEIIRSKQESASISAKLGQDKLINRLVTFFSAVIFFTLAIYGLFKSMFKGQEEPLQQA